MKANFVKVNPSGNTTVLILDPFSRDVQPRVASAVMKPACLAAEQVGFVERGTIPGAIARLQMMGGEFCGNASRGFAAWLVERRFPGISLPTDSDTVSVPIEVSGYAGLLGAEVRVSMPHTQTHVYLSMPIPRWIEPLRSGDDTFTLVGFDGIVHAVVWDRAVSVDEFYVIKRAVYGKLREVPCLGVMFFQEEKQFLTPVVYVKGVDSLVWEGSCGSGTVAVAAALCSRDKRTIKGLKVFQPGGMIEASATWNEKVSEAGIGGAVRFEAEGVVYFEV